MKVKNEARRIREREMDGLLFLPCELIYSSANLPDKYSYMNASFSSGPPCLSHSSVISAERQPSVMNLSGRGTHTVAYIQKRQCARIK